MKIRNRIEDFVIRLRIFIGPRCSWGPIYGSKYNSFQHLDLTDVTLADEDGSSIPTGDVNRSILVDGSIQSNVSSPIWRARQQPIHAAPPGGQTNASNTT